MRNQVKTQEEWSVKKKQYQLKKMNWHKSKLYQWKDKLNYNIAVDQS